MRITFNAATRKLGEELAEDMIAAGQAVAYTVDHDDDHVIVSVDLTDATSDALWQTLRS